MRLLLILSLLFVSACASTCPRAAHYWERVGPGVYGCPHCRSMADDICDNKVVVLEHGRWVGPDPWRGYPSCNSDAKKALKAMLEVRSAESAAKATYRVPR